MEARQSCRPIHHYDRLERFKSTLDQLLGCRGKISDEIMDLMVGVKISWESIRRVLKSNQIRKLYNQIPLIIRKLTGKSCIEFTDFSSSYSSILKQFQKIHYRFNLDKGDEKKYFPNLRFVALTLIKLNGGRVNWKIPFIRTKRKLARLESIIKEFI